MVVITDVKDAVKKLKAFATPASHGGVNAIVAMRQAANKLGVKVSPDTWMEFFGILAVTTGDDLSEGDFEYLAENWFANSSPELLALLDIKWKPAE